MMKATRLVLAVGVLALSVTAAGTAVALETFTFKDTKTFSLGSAPEIDVESISGDVSYEGSDVADVTVSIVVTVEAADEAEAHEIEDEIEIIVEGKGDYLEARVDQPDNLSRRLRRNYGRDRSISVSFLLTGPKGALGSLSSVSGSVTAGNMAGPLDVSSVSGEVRASAIQDRLRANSVSGMVLVTGGHDNVDASTVSGDLDVTDCDGNLEVSSVSGAIHARDIAGQVDASNVSGDIDLMSIGGEAAANTVSGVIDVEHRSGNLDLESVSGDITARSESVDGILRAHSNSGGIRLYATCSQIGRVNLSTFSGAIDIDSELGDDKETLRRVRGRGDIRLTTGSGDLVVDVDTHSGDILIGEL